MVLSIERLSAAPGQTLTARDVSWTEFESLLTALGPRRHSRLAYYQRQLDIMAPLPEHEINKVLISNLIEILLEELELEFYPLGSTTFKNKLLGLGVEPDSCFYIENEAQVRGKKRLDLSQDPPPDLVLEVDLTSRTYLEIYAQLGVPEVWRFAGNQLQIHCLTDGAYQAREFSPLFPYLPLKTVIPLYLEQIDREGRNKTLKAFRAWVQSQRSGAEMSLGRIKRKD